MHILLKLSLVLLILSACTKPLEKPPQPVIPQAPTLPITEVYQTFAEDYEIVWDNIVAVLNDRNIGVQMADKEIGRIVTEWVEIDDYMCGVESSKETPLRCRVQYSIAASRMAERGSSITIRYLETCYDREQMNLVCPKSKAERLMVNLIDDMKALSAVQQHRKQ